jgi:hypothetical protein
MGTDQKTNLCVGAAPTIEVFNGLAANSGRFCRERKPVFPQTEDGLAATAKPTACETITLFALRCKLSGRSACWRNRADNSFDRRLSPCVSGKFRYRCLRAGTMEGWYRVPARTMKLRSPMLICGFAALFIVCPLVE